MDTALSHLDLLLKFLKDFRAEGFEKCLLVAKEMATANNIIPEFKERRIIKRKCQFGYECTDQPITENQEYFRIEYFFLILDKALTSFEERFNLYETFTSNFGFLYDFNNLTNISEEQIFKNCHDLYNILKDGENEDINGLEIYEELKSFRHLITDKNINSILDILKYIVVNKLDVVYPNICIAIRILLTLPVTVASNERSFSKLKLIKNYLRSTMSEERLIGLAMMSIEKDISNDIDYDKIIDEFAGMKARKGVF